MGAGVLAAMKKKSLLGAGKKPVIAYLNGGPTDNNSKLFKQGYGSILDPLIKSGKAAKGPDQGVPEWDNQKARTVFEQMLVKTGNKIDAVAAANAGNGAYEGASSATMASSSSLVKARTVRGAGMRLRPASVAGLRVMYPQRTAAPSV